MTTIDITNFKTIPSLFCQEGDAADIRQYDYDDHSLNFLTGIVERFAKPVGDGLDGEYIHRDMVNAIGRVSSAAAFLGEIGHIYGYVTGVAYRAGAVVDVVDGMNGVVRRLMCTQDGASAPEVSGDKVVVDGWSFADGIALPDYALFWAAVQDFMVDGEYAGDEIGEGEKGA